MWAGFSVLESGLPTLIAEEASQRGTTGVVKTGSLSVSFSNASFESVSGNLRAQARSVTINVAPVPEHSTWAMLLAGLLAVGAWARRGVGTKKADLFCYCLCSKLFNGSGDYGYS